MQLQRLVASLQAKHPGAAASMREGSEETLTVQALGITGALYRTLRTTNPIENLNGLIAHFTRNVKRWKDGAMTPRWVARCIERRQGAISKAARASRNEVPDDGLGGSANRRALQRKKSRVVSRQRSRHPAAFNSDRDIAE